MAPRKKGRNALKRSSSDGPTLEDEGSIRKRARADAPAETTSDILPVPHAHKSRNQVKYKSRVRQSRESNGSPAKLTSFGFERHNVENKPKVGRALFHLNSPSPRAKAKSKKVFGSPKFNKRRGSKAGASANNSRVDISVDEDESGETAERQVTSPELINLLTPSTPPRPSGTNTGSDERDEQNDQPAPLPFLSPVKPIEGPGLEIRTPLKGRIFPASIHSLSKRMPRTDTPSIPLFAATPRPPQLLDHPTDDSPSKPHTAPVFAPTSTLAPVPSTPAHPSKPAPSFAPSAQRLAPTAQNDGSPTKKPAPIFGPTPARAPPSLRTEHDTNTIPRPVFAPDSIRTPAHPDRNLPAIPPPLPTTSSAVPETTIPETPTARRRTPPTFMPGLLFPPPEQTSNENQKTRVSRAPVFGGLDEGEEETPRAEKDKPLSAEPEARVEQGEEEDTSNQGDLSMADLFDASIITPEGHLDLPKELKPRGASIPTGEPAASATADTLGPLASLSESVVVAESHPFVATDKPSVVTRSRSRSASASGSVPPDGTTKVRSRTGSVSLSRANSVSAPGRTESRGGSNTPLTPIITNLPVLPRSNSMEQLNLNPLAHLQYRLGQVDPEMTDTSTPGNETPPILSGAGDGYEDEGHMSTSPLSSLPEDMSLDILEVGSAEGDMEEDTTIGEGDGAGSSTIRIEDTTIRDADLSMSMRDPAQMVLSSPFSLRAPSSPVSSVLAGDSAMNEDEEVDVVGLSSPPRPLPLPDSMPSPTTSTSTLTSLDEDTEDEKERKQEKKARKSMIPVPKRHGATGAGTMATKTPLRAQNGMTLEMISPTRNGFTPGPARPGFSKNGSTPAPGRNGMTPAPAKVATVRAAPTPIRPPTGPPTQSFPVPSTSTVESSTATLDASKSATSKSGMATRTRAGVGRTARSLAAPTASTAAKTRTKVVTAPPPRGRITNFMKPNASARPMPPPAAPVAPVPSESAPASPRKGMSKDDSDIRGPRRSMISDDTQASLSSLSNALEKLARTSIGNTRATELPARPGTSMGFAPRPNSSLGFNGASRPGLDGPGARPAHMPGGTKRPFEPSGKGLKPSAGPGASKLTNTTNLSSSKGKGKAKDGEVSKNDDDADYQDGKKGKAKGDPNAPLRSCVIFVDVRTAEGEDAGSLFIDMLRGLGAKVVSKPTPSTTHFVFKSGHQSTLTKHKLWDDPRPFLVGIGWVVECVEKREHASEERFEIKTDEVSALDLRERRKSQLPHQMQFMVRDPNPAGPKFGTTSAEAAAVAKSLQASMAEVEQDAEAAAERSKKRAQQKLFPRIRDRSPT